MVRASRHGPATGSWTPVARQRPGPAGSGVTRNGPRSLAGRVRASLQLGRPHGSAGRGGGPHGQYVRRPAPRGPGPTRAVPLPPGPPVSNGTLRPVPARPVPASAARAAGGLGRARRFGPGQQRGHGEHRDGHAGLPQHRAAQGAPARVGVPGPAAPGGGHGRPLPGELCGPRRPPTARGRSRRGGRSALGAPRRRARRHAHRRVPPGVAVRHPTAVRTVRPAVRTVWTSPGCPGRRRRPEARTRPGRPVPWTPRAPAPVRAAR